MNKDSVKRHKKELREKFTALRMSLDKQSTEKKSAQIHQHLFASSMFANSGTIHTYVSMNHRNEVDTLALIHTSLQKGKSVVIPRIEDEVQLSHHQINSTGDLKRNEWGVPEPAGEGIINPEDLDLILVPMLGGDRFRNRLGYGKGFYDRFLKETDALKLGLLFDIQMYAKRLPINKYDVQMDLLITESGIF